MMSLISATFSSDASTYRSKAEILDSPLSFRSKNNKVTFKQKTDLIINKTPDLNDKSKIYFHRQNLIVNTETGPNGELIFKKLKPSLKQNETKKHKNYQEFNDEFQQDRLKSPSDHNTSKPVLNNKSLKNSKSSHVKYVEVTNQQSIQHAKIQFYDSLLNRSSTNLFLNNYLSYSNQNSPQNKGPQLYKSSPSLNEIEPNLNSEFINAGDDGYPLNVQTSKTKIKNNKLSDLKPELLKRRISIKHFANVEKQSKLQSINNTSKYKINVKSTDNQLSIIPEVNEYFNDKIKLVKDESLSKSGQYVEDESLKNLLESSKDGSSSYGSLNRLGNTESIGKDSKPTRLENYSAQRNNYASSLPNLYSNKITKSDANNYTKSDQLKKIQSQFQLENTLNLFGENLASTKLDKPDSVYKFTRLLDKKIMEGKKSSLKIKFPHLVNATSSMQHLSSNDNEKSQVFSNSNSFVISDNVFNSPAIKS